MTFLAVLPVRVWLALVAALAVACADPGPAVDEPDASPTSPTVDATNRANCPAASAFTSPQVSAPTAVWLGDSADDPTFIVADGVLEAGPPIDRLQLELYRDVGVFAGYGIRPDTYVLTGDELNYATCGACVLVHADLDADDNPAAYYLATSGSLDVVSVTPTFQATLRNAHFRHVEIDAQTYQSTAILDECDITIDTVTLQAPSTAWPGSSATARVRPRPAAR